MPSMHITAAFVFAFCSQSILARPLAQDDLLWGDINIVQGETPPIAEYTKRDDVANGASTNGVSSDTAFVPGIGDVKLGPHGEMPPSVEGAQKRDEETTIASSIDDPSDTIIVPNVDGIRLGPHGELPPDEEEIAGNTTITGRSEFSSSDLEEGSRIEKREEKVVMGSYMACARKYQKDYPVKKLNAQQIKTCTDIKNVKKVAKRGETSIDAPGATRSGNYELQGINCGPSRVLGSFLLTKDFKIETDKICNAMLYSGYDKLTQMIAPPPDPKSTFGNMVGSWAGGIVARKKIAATLWHVSANRVGVYTSLVNYALKGNAENAKLAMDLCKITVDKVSGNCEYGFDAGGVTRQAQKAATATWIDAKTRLPALAFEYSFYN